MKSWTAALCKDLMRNSEKIRTVQKLTFSQNSHNLTLLSSPSIQLSFDELHKDPFIVNSSDRKYDEICIQQDPMKTMLRLRHFLRNSLNYVPDSSSYQSSIEFELPIIRELSELKTNLEVSHYLKPAPSNTEESVSNIVNNILSKNFLGYPFTASSVIYTLLKNEQCFLIDIPDAMLSINIANQLNLSELIKIYEKVLDEYIFISEDESYNELTTGEIAHLLFPEVFQKPRDEFVLSILQKKIETVDILAVVSAPTFLAIKKKWNEKIDFNKVNKLTTRNPQDTDEVLIEKHAILDAVLGSKAWGDKFMYNRFPYIDQKENIDKDRKSVLQGIFHSKFQQYISPLAEVKKKLEKKFKESQESENKPVPS